MRKINSLVIVFVIISSSFFVTSCNFTNNSWGNNLCPPVKKEFKLQQQIPDNMTFYAETMHSHINVSGSDDNYCYVTANVKVRAENTEKANQIAETIKVTLNVSGNNITLLTDRLGFHDDYSVYADYDVKLPKNSNVILKTTHDPIHCRNLKGDVTASTSHDPIILTNITGKVDARTTHDPIRLTNITGDVKASTTHDPIEAQNITGNLHLTTTHDRINCSNINTKTLYARTTHANVNITYSTLSTSPLTADISSSHGNITLDLPPDYSGTLSMSTTHGRVKTDFPITVTGEISEKNIHATIGAKNGKGKVNLKTTHGSIHLK